MPDSPYFFPQASIKSMAAFYRSIYPGWNEAHFQELGKMFRLDTGRKLNAVLQGNAAPGFLLARPKLLAGCAYHG